MPDRLRREDAAVLRPTRARERLEIGKVDRPDDLADLVDYCWWVRWDTPEPHEQDVIPRHVVHVAVEQVDGRPRLLVHGVHRRRFVRRLEGSGTTVALAFRPGGFHPLLGSSVAALRDREVTADEVLGVDDAAVAERALAVEPGDGAHVLLDWVRALAPEPDPLVPRLAGLAERVEQDRTITRVDRVAELAGVGQRTLQRQFLEYVGTSPKWVVQRCRLLDVAEAAHSEEDVDWAGLAVELGYTDQSHLIRGFTALVGRPPASYAAEA